MGPRTFRIPAFAGVALIVLSVAAPSHAINLVGSKADEIAWGTASRDVIAGKAGNDVVWGQGGNDTLSAGSAPLGEFLFLGSGTDTAKGSRRTDLIVDEDGTPGDVINGGDQGDIIFSRDSEVDTIDCGGGHDTALIDGIDKLKHCEIVFQLTQDLYTLGTTQHEHFNGDTDANIILADKGNDTVHGGTELFGGDPFLSGGPGDDDVFGDGGNDVIIDDDSTAGDILNGGNGDDMIFAADGAGGDITCGAGTDRVIADETLDEIDADCELVATGAGELAESTFSPF